MQKIGRQNISILLKNFLWLFFLGLGFLGFISIWFFMPLTQSINSNWQFFYKLLIYIVISAAVAVFPNKLKWVYFLLLGCFFILLGFIIPRISYLGAVLMPIDRALAYDQFYTMIFFILYPFIGLAVGFAYRIGGGSAGKTLKLILASQIILLSGYLDLMWHIINGVKIEQTLNGLHHIKIIIGHFPTFTETIIFALCHIPLLIGLFLLPIDKWINKINLFLERKHDKNSSN